jgi:drug/metabolite transporter (DMT)-like permease
VRSSAPSGSSSTTATTSGSSCRRIERSPWCVARGEARRGAGPRGDARDGRLGRTPVATRLATDDLEPLLVAVLRTVFAGVVAAPLLAVRRQRPPRGARLRTLLLVSAAAGFIVFPVVYTVGQQRTSAMHGAIILAALPVFTGLYAAIVLRRRPGSVWLAGCGAALAGELVIIAVRAETSGGEATLVGDVLVLVAALVVSAGYVAGAMLLPRGLSSTTTTFWCVTIGAVVLAPVGIGILAAGGLGSAGAEAWGAVLFLAFVTSIAGYIGWYWALDRGGISRIATLQFLQPLSGLVLAALVLDESLTLPLAAGAIAIIGGVSIAQRAR